MTDAASIRCFNTGLLLVYQNMALLIPVSAAFSSKTEAWAECDLGGRLPGLLGLLRLVLWLLGWLLVPAGVLGLHLPLLCPGQGRWGSRLRPVVARLLGQ